MDDLYRLLRTVRYLKPIQVFGRIWFMLHNPTIPSAPPLPERIRSTRWIEPPCNRSSLLAPSRFRFLNEEHDLLLPSDWNNKLWEKLWLYHLHYFDDLKAAEAGQRADWHKSLIQRWIKDNSPGIGNGWEPYPLSRRIVNWIKWALNGHVMPACALESLAAQARFLRRRLEWHILGNHLIANAKALIFAGLFFDGTEANDWLIRGASIVSRQLKEQILADGGHFERSPMYHAHVLEDILDMVNALRAFPDCAFTGREQFLAQCVGKAGKMLAWLKVMSHPDGEIALLNDSAFNETPMPAALEAYAIHLGMEAGEYPAPTSSSAGPVRFTHLENTGYVRMVCGDVTAFLDVAPIGPDYQPGHAHADTLSFELSLGRQRVIVDSGVSRYGDGPERLRQRGTAAHNTVQINGQDSSEVWGGFRVARRAYPKDLHIEAAKGLVSCAHDGYRRLPGKPIHRREWHFRESGLRIRDTIEGDFREAAARLHFHPEVKVAPSAGSHAVASSSGACDSGKIVLPGGREMNIQIVNGRGLLCETTWHPEFGLSIPNQCLEISFTDRDIVIELSWK